MKLIFVFFKSYAADGENFSPSVVRCVSMKWTHERKFAEEPVGIRLVWPTYSFQKKNDLVGNTPCLTRLPFSKKNKPVGNTPCLTGPVAIYASRYAKTIRKLFLMIGSYDIWCFPILGRLVICLHEKSFNFDGYFTLMIICRSMLSIYPKCEFSIINSL